jgi:hypothetical protein
MGHRRPRLCSFSCFVVIYKHDDFWEALNDEDQKYIRPGGGARPFKGRKKKIFYFMNFNKCRLRARNRTLPEYL